MKKRYAQYEMTVMVQVAATSMKEAEEAVRETLGKIQKKNPAKFRFAYILEGGKAVRRNKKSEMGMAPSLYGKGLVP